MRSKESEASKCFDLAWKVSTNFETTPNILTRAITRQLIEIANDIQKNYIKGRISNEELEIQNKIFLGFYGYKGNTEEPPEGVLDQN